jgi:hypothetical protein
MKRLQFGTQREELNDDGLFEIEEPGTPTTTVRLLINNTAVNNQTVINCDRRAPGEEATTTLSVFSRSLFMHQNTICVTIGMQILVQLFLWMLV